MQPEDSELEYRRRELARAFGRFSTIVLPIGVALSFVGLVGGPVFTLAAQAGILGCGVPVLRALYRLALEAGGPRYARTQLQLAVLLTPVAYMGLWAMPLLVLSDADKGVARWREETTPRFWFVVLDTLVVVLVLGLGVGLVSQLGVAGLFVAAIAVPVLYKGFRVVTQAAR